MTDEQIIKALECCCHSKNICEKCPVYDECMNSPFVSVLAKYSLDLINRIQTEQEIMRDSVKRLCDYNNNLIKANTVLSNELFDTRANVAKELAERLKSLAYIFNDWSHGKHP